MDFCLPSGKAAGFRGNDNQMKNPDVLSRLLDFDLKLVGRSCAWAAGVDEAGRGPLAGPVTAAAVILKRPEFLTGLNDSKKIPPKTREKFFFQIIRYNLVGIGSADEDEIDAINIYQASRLAMKRAVLALTRTPDLILIDGKARLDLPLPQKTVVKGDAQSAAIAAASIVAKVYRDFWMLDLHERYPVYEFNKHKGYGTALHLAKLKECGPSRIHRRTFAPVRSVLHEKENSR